MRGLRMKEAHEKRVMIPSLIIELGDTRVLRMNPTTGGMFGSSSTDCKKAYAMERDLSLVSLVEVGVEREAAPVPPKVPHWMMLDDVVFGFGSKN
jgi:hypothetical protein